MVMRGGIWHLIIYGHMSETDFFKLSVDNQLIAKSYCLPFFLQITQLTSETHWLRFSLLFRKFLWLSILCVSKFGYCKLGVDTSLYKIQQEWRYWLKLLQKTDIPSLGLHLESCFKLGLVHLMSINISFIAFIGWLDLHPGSGRC